MLTNTTATEAGQRLPDVLAIAPAAGPIVGVARVPGSKSITNRALLVAALADGESELVGALHSDDTRYMAEGLDALGLAVEADEAGERFVVTGGGGASRRHGRTCSSATRGRRCGS